MPHRFSRDAINEVAELFAKDPAVRASNPLHGLSDAAKELVKTLETERDEAAAEGVEGDWWAGVIRKGVSVEAQVEHAREKMSRAGIDWKELLGVDGMGMEEAVGIPKGMQYVDYDDDVKEDGEVNNQGFASMTSIVATMEEGEEEDMEMKDTEELAARHLARAVATNDMT